MESPVEVEKIESGAAHAERAGYPPVLLLVALGQIGWGGFVVLLAALPWLDPAGKILSPETIAHWVGRLSFEPPSEPSFEIYLLAMAGAFRCVCGLGLLVSMRWARDLMTGFSAVLVYGTLRGVGGTWLLGQVFNMAAERALLASPDVRQRMFLYLVANAFTLMVLVAGPGVEERFRRRRKPQGRRVWEDEFDRTK